MTTTNRLQKDVINNPDIEYAVRFHFEPDHYMGKCVEFITAQDPNEAESIFLNSAIPEMKVDSVTPRHIK